MKRMMFVGVGIAVALFFVSGPVAASAEETPIVSYEDTPYIDAEGNIDYELAKDYAELVDSYTDENGTKWEVWLDEFGGHMWTESLTVDGILGFEDLFVPYYVVVYRSGQPYVYYSIPGSTCGHMWYVGSCGTHCYKWDACSDSSQYSCDPVDVTRVAAHATSDDDYCDANYIGYFHYPDGAGGWEFTDSYTCGTVGGSSWYALDDDDPNGTTDYGVGEKMVRWHYHVSSVAYYTDVYYYGPCII
jgi:hypothetical protein